VTTACDACLRRSWLVARLAGRIELVRHEQTRLPEILALPDHALIAAVAGAEATRVRAERAAFDAAAARRDVAAARLTAVCRHAPQFPPRLAHARDAPAVLHVAGDSRLLRAFAGDDPAASIVGMRRASPYGRDVARALARDLASAGVPIVSGMALGVDSEAHAGALDAGGLTVAVLAGGADVPYPASKRHLHAEIRRRGLVVSELPPGFRARRWCFPARNRIIAALGDLTIVVEAAERSGSLITADLAARLGREVAAVPGPVTAPGAAGTNALLRDGATLVRDARDALDALFGVGNAPPPRAAGAPSASTLEPALSPPRRRRPRPRHDRRPRRARRPTAPTPPSSASPSSSCAASSAASRRVATRSSRDRAPLPRSRRATSSPSCSSSPALGALFAAIARPLATRSSATDAALITARFDAGRRCEAPSSSRAHRLGCCDGLAAHDPRGAACSSRRASSSERSTRCRSGRPLSGRARAVPDRRGLLLA
jgi:DNA processing protein